MSTVRLFIVSLVKYCDFVKYFLTNMAMAVVVFEAYFLWNFVCAEAIHNCMNM